VRTDNIGIFEPRPYMVLDAPVLFPGLDRDTAFPFSFVVFNFLAGFYNILLSLGAVERDLPPKWHSNSRVCSNTYKINELQKNRGGELSENFPIDGRTVAAGNVLTKNIIKLASTSLNQS
jgi:hypothetical protein